VAEPVSALDALVAASPFSTRFAATMVPAASVVSGVEFGFEHPAVKDVAAMSMASNREKRVSMPMLHSLSSRFRSCGFEGLLIGRLSG